MARHVPYDDPGSPDLRSPWRYLWWLVFMQRWRVLAGAFWGSLWMCGLIVPPYLIAKAIEDGLRAVTVPRWCGGVRRCSW